MAHVFISYSHQDHDYARKLADHLLANGFDVWIDDRIDFGSRWIREIFTAIDSCSALIVVMTPRAYEREWVENERLYAKKRSKIVFPLLLEGDAFPDLGATQYYDVSGGKLPEPSFLERLATFVPRRATNGEEVAAAPQQQAKVKFETSQIGKAEVAAAAPPKQPPAHTEQRRFRSLLVFAAAVMIIALMVVFGATMNPQLLTGFSPTPMPTLLGGGHGQIAFVSDEDGNNEIYVVNFDGTDRRNLTNDPADDTEPTWSPDGTQIAFSSDREDGNSRIFIMDADGTNVHHLAEDLIGWDPAWSPDGTQIALTGDWEGSAEILVVDTAGNHLKALTNNSFSDGYASWSPDGTQIVFVSEPDGNEDLYIVDADAENPPRLLFNMNNNSEDEKNPTWSPSGMRVAFQTYADEYPQICLIGVDSDNLDCITSDPDDATEPAWSPDGTQIVFASYRDSNSGKELYIMDADGSNIRRLTDTPTDERFPAWRS